MLFGCWLFVWFVLVVLILFGVCFIAYARVGCLLVVLFGFDSFAVDFVLVICVCVCCFLRFGLFVFVNCLFITLFCCLIWLICRLVVLFVLDYVFCFFCALFAMDWWLCGVLLLCFVLLNSVVTVLSNYFCWFVLVLIWFGDCLYLFLLFVLLLSGWLVAFGLTLDLLWIRVLFNDLLCFRLFDVVGLGVFVFSYVGCDACMWFDYLAVFCLLFVLV